MDRKIVLVGWVVMGGLIGCASSESAPQQGKPSELHPAVVVASKGLTLRLAAGDGNKLHLVESGRPGYAAEYTNPKKLADMVVNVKATGSVVSLCHDATGAVVRCGSTPFFTKVQKLAASTLVKVTDVHGQDCGSEEFADSDVENEDDSASPDDDEAACNCSSSTPSDDDSASGGGGMCDEPAILAKRDAFCGEVNDYLAKQSMSPIDCSALDVAGNYDDDDDIEQPDAQDMDCEDIWSPAFKQVTSWLSSCKGVKIRATQWHEVVRWNLLLKGACDGSPIVLDLDGNGIRASTPEEGVRFDLLGRGAVQTAWIEGADAFLALDRDGNGRIDGARELFGNATRGARWSDGFAALAELDTNNDGRIDERDAVYHELVLWRDANRDGASGPGELTSLSDAGIRALYLGAATVTGSAMFDPNHNRIPLVAGFERTDGTRGTMADIFLRYTP